MRVFQAKGLDKDAADVVERDVRSFPVLSLATGRLSLWAEGAGRGFWRRWSDRVRLRSMRGTSVFSEEPK